MMYYIRSALTQVRVRVRAKVMIQVRGRTDLTIVCDCC